ncbi:hypothetical protein [Polluticoccus soli]|uniref:hypothetical protein n=1 Tax=Polluticoccus soli TaxID=3034150 RepID=UPI0023E1294E|nr:hypothetical protein [Flavipsychrobacter sp. JY13-12]
MSFKNAMQSVQKNLLQYAKQGRPYEVLAAVLAARQFNTSIVETDLHAEEGKKRQLKINYYAPICEDNGTGTENFCDPGNAIAPKQMYFNLDQVTASANYSLNRDDIRMVDGHYSFSDHAKAAINAALPAVRRKLAVQVAELLIANNGILPDGNATRMLPFLDKTQGTVNPMGLWEIERNFRDAGLSNPFIIGGTDVFHWRKAVEIGGVNEKGQNVSQMGRANAYYDSLINDAYGDTSSEHILAFDPQVLKFVSFNRNAGIFATDLQNIDAIDTIYQQGGTDYLHGVMADPVTGLLWDLNISYEKCSFTWMFQWRLEWDIFFMPPAVCNVTGVNGVFHYTTCAPVEYTCPTGGTPATPGTSDTFDWDTNGVIMFPLFINKLELAGQESYPATTVADITELRDLFNDSVTGYVFSVTGTKLRYAGYAGISGQINDTTNISFTATP